MDPSAAFEAINEFVKLAAERRVKALPSAKKHRLDVLEEAIREVVDGARPAPKRIENPSAAQGITPAHGVAPAKIELKASQALEQALSSTDKLKLSSVKVEDLPKSTYTPPSVPAYMADYYSDSLVPARVSTSDLPTTVVSATGETLDLDREVRVLLGLDRPEAEEAPGAPPLKEVVSVRGAPARAASRPARAASTSAPAGVQVIVHLIAGGTQRGRVDAFDPKAPELLLLGKDADHPPTPVPLRGVLAIFFGTRRGASPSAPMGTSLVVQLVNDRQISGRSPDYAEGRDSLTLVPEPRRGAIDHIWVPAWAVKAIELLD